MATVRQELETPPAAVFGLAPPGERSAGELGMAAELGMTAERLLSMLAAAIAAEREARAAEREAADEARAARAEATAAKLAAERLQRVAAAAVNGRGLRRRRRARRQLRDLLAG